MTTEGDNRPPAAWRAIAALLECEKDTKAILALSLQLNCMLDKREEEKTEKETS